MDRTLRLLTFSNVAFHELSLRRRVMLSQLPLSATMLVVLLFVATLHAHDLPDSRFQLAMVLNAVLFLLCAVVPWERLPFPSFLVIPVLDFLPITLLREALDATLSGIGLLAVFPVIWLAASGQLPRIAVPLGALLTLAMVWAPLLAPDAEVNVDTVTGPLLIPFMMFGIGTTIQVLVRSMEEQNADLEAKDAENRRLLAEADRRERLLDTVLGAVDVGVLAIDAAGHDVLGNRMQRAMHQVLLPPGAQDGAEADLLVFGDDGVTPLPAAERPAARAVRGESFTGELVRVGTAPHQRVHSVSARAMVDRSGRHDGTVLTFSDVTELVAALQAKDEFLAGVSHELRTPLTSIRGYTELLAMDRDLPEDVRAGLGVIERNADQLSTLIGDLLGTTTKAADLRLVPSDLVAVVHQSVAAAEVRAGAAGVELRVEVPSRLDLVCDPVRIGQVLDNLLSNAIKYSPQGGPVIVRAVRVGGDVRCEVVDRGTGMGAEDAASVFDRFFRARQARESGAPGLGLGLTIAQQIVEQHGGRIRCESELGQGTIFTVTLPVGGERGEAVDPDEPAGAERHRQAARPGAAAP